MSGSDSRIGSQRGRGFVVTLIVAAIVPLSDRRAARGAEAPPASISHALRQEAPSLIAAFRELGYKNVGVLKFRIIHGDGRPSDDAGPLCFGLADQLQVALLLANDLQDPVGIVHNASAVAAGIPGANHVTTEGRAAFFRRKYPLAWGDQEVEPDAFLSGIVEVPNDLGRIKVHVLAFDRKAPEKLVKLAEVDAPADRATFAGSGGGILVRGLISEDGQLAPSTLKIEDVRDDLHSPLTDPDAPVGLEVRYNDRPVPYEVGDGRLVVREPLEGEKVSFMIQKRDRTPDRYGVVLFINGLDTLDGRRRAVEVGGKWIVGPDSPQIAVRGFQAGLKENEPFSVLSRQDSNLLATQYGDDAGVVTFAAFREVTASRPNPRRLDELDDDVMAMKMAVLPTRTAKNLGGLLYQLRNPSVVGTTRGLLAPSDKREKALIQIVRFRGESTPFLSATFRYYTPRKP